MAAAQASVTATGPPAPGAAGSISGGGEAGRHGANMLLPQAYDVAWTDLRQPFNLTLSPGELAAITGTPLPAAANEALAAPATPVTVGNFPSGPMTPGDRDWANPQSAAMIPIGPSSSGQVLAGNPKRVLLIIQNNSASGGATFWIAFGQSAVQFNSIGLAPGQSLTLDAAVPRDSVNILITGAVGVTAGVIVEAAYVAQKTQSYSPVNVGAEAWGYVSPPAAPTPVPPAPQPAFATLWNPPPPPAAAPAPVRSGFFWAPEVIP